MITRPILLVEDNPDDVELTRRAFKKARIVNELIVKPDGRSAIDHLLTTNGQGEFNPLPAFVLLDLKLPLVGGLEVLEKLRSHERTRMLPVIILTSSREESDLLAGYSNFANSYICKPVDFSKFYEAVQQVGMYWLVLNEQPKTLQQL